MTHRPYPSYKDSGIEWLGDASTGSAQGIPEHWDVVGFRRVVDIAGGQVDPENEQYSSMNLIAPNHIESGTGRLWGMETAAEQSAESGKYLCKAGDVIYSKIRPALRKACIAPEDCLCSADMYPLSGRQNLSNRYLFWTILSEEFSAYTILESDRVAMPKVNRESLNALPLLVPPLPEQQAIAAFLDRETAKIDGLVAEQERLIELLTEKRSAVISHAVTRGLDPSVPLKDSGVEWLGQVPAPWEVKRVRQILNGLEQGWSPVAEDRMAEDDEWAVIKLSAIKAGHFYSNEHKALDQSVVIPSALELKVGDVLLTRANTPDLVGDACIVRESRKKLIFSDLVFRLDVVRAALLPEFLLNFLISKPGRAQIQLDAKGSNQSMVKISQGSISTWVMPLPPLPEQQAIAAYLDEQTARFDALMAEARRGIELLKERRTALISAAVTGKIDVREAA